ncbi:hypothetical protein [Xanthomonas nasturtii]|uniref:hypothetical protein n=1 Tax=Xanthomonas nasturtii TaxID=1843581 RepID=UPI001EFBFABF|nr:hypothetical protein [Xanthomonas nasturtii]
MTSSKNEITASDSLRATFFKTVRTDQLDWSLPAHRRGTLSGMDAAPEPPWTDSRRVLRWWAGEGPATQSQISSSTTDLSALSNRFDTLSR